MVTLKVAFQGGGARLATLIAAADALRIVEETRGITIARVAGASAGAIAAAMFSSPTAIAEQLAHIREVGPSLIEKINKRRFNSTILLDVARGRSLLDEAILRDFLAGLLKSSQTENGTINDLRIPTSIVSTNIISRQRIIHDETTGGKLVDAIVDSCALPFAFRTHRNSGIVDGGICSNLPVDIILTGEAPEAVPCAFSFRKSERVRPEPKNVVEFSVALLESSIDAGVEIGAARIRSAGGYVCELPDQFGTFQFADALNWGLDKVTYSAVRDQILHDLQAAIEPISANSARRKIQAHTPPLQKVVYDAHLNLMSAFPYRVSEASTIVFANSVCQEGDERHGRDDEVYQTAVCHVDEGSQFVALRIGMPIGAFPAGYGQFSVVQDRRGKQLPSQQMVIERDDPKGLFGTLRFNLIFLNDPLPYSDGPITLIYRSMMAGAMKSLGSEGADWLRSRGGDQQLASTENLILLVPNDFLPVRMEDLSDAINRLPAHLEPAAKDHVAQQWVKGTSMAEPEVAQALAPLGVATQMGWRALGWKAVDVPKGFYCGVFFNTSS